VFGKDGSVKDAVVVLKNPKLEGEPQVFSHPDMGSRFHLFEVTDPWM
jgi:hypothetical protein